MHRSNSGGHSGSLPSVASIPSHCGTPTTQGMSPQVSPQTVMIPQVSLMHTPLPPPKYNAQSGSDTDVSTSNENINGVPRGERQEPQGEETLIADELNNTLVIRNNASIDGFTSPFYGKNSVGGTSVYLNHNMSPSKVNAVIQGHLQNKGGVQEIQEIPKHYLDQSSVLKHLAKEIQIQPSVQTMNQPQSPSHNMASPAHSPSQGAPQNHSQDENGNKIIHLLTQENQALKSELDIYHSKVSRLERLEAELHKLHNAQEEIISANENRERLETALRAKMEMEIQRLQGKLKQQGDIESMQQELGRRDLLIAQLLGQNKELLCEKERKDVEIHAQHATLQEQRKHIDILDQALTNAQANICRLEEEVRKKEFYAERVHELQKALQQMQAASERRLEMEKKMRSELEKDVQSLGRRGVSEEELRKSIRDYEEKVVALEGEVARWEQKYLEESALRQMAVDAASVPKDARIAALERNSVETERLITQVRNEKLKQMDELHGMQRKCAELESKVKDVESKLAEKDAMIRVLQQRSSIHARAASSVALTHHRRTGSKDETITSRAEIDESLKEFGSRLANKGLLGCADMSVTSASACGSAISTAALTSKVTLDGKLSLSSVSSVPHTSTIVETPSPTSTPQGDSTPEMKIWCV